MASLSPAPWPRMSPHPADPESFAALFEESLNRKEMRVGEVITAEVLSIDDNFVVVNAGLKSESTIAIEEFRTDAGQIEVKVGDFVSVAIEALEDGYGSTRLSRDKAKRMAAWIGLEKALESGEKIKGVITGKVKGGLTVMANGIRAFLPGSLVDLRPVKDTTPYEGKEMEFKVIKLDRKRNNVVVSRRAVLEETAGAERQNLLASLQEGATVKGIVKNITPSKVVQVGDEVEVMILEIDEERRRISLGMKQCMPNPWEDFAREYKKGDKVKGQIKSITDFGVFVGLPGGIDGLVHLSDLSWSATGEEAVKNFKKGEDLEAVVLSIDVERERISLGVKQLEGDPFTNFIASHDKNSLVSGTVKTVDAKGAVVDIGGVEGYLRASEFSRDRVDDLAKHLKEGDAVQAMIINVDRKNRSINLSVKAKDLSEETDAMKQLRTENAAASAGAGAGLAACSLRRLRAPLPIKAPGAHRHLGDPPHRFRLASGVRRQERRSGHAALLLRLGVADAAGRAAVRLLRRRRALRRGGAGRAAHAPAARDFAAAQTHPAGGAGPAAGARALDVRSRNAAALVADRLRHLFRTRLAGRARRHPPGGARVAFAAALLLQGTQLPAERAARQGDRGLRRCGQGRPGDDRAALRARQPVPPARRV